MENETETNEEIYELAETGQESLVVKIFVEELQEKLREVYKNVMKNRDFMVEKSRIQHDRNIKPFEYKVEDMVMLNQPQMKKGLSKKLSPKWDGPYIIQDKLGTVNYKIKKYNQPNSKPKLVHHNRLKRFFGSHFIKIDDSVVFDQSKNNQNLVKRRKHKKIVRAKINRNLDKTPETQQSNEVQNEQQEFLVDSSESVQESADEDDETFKPNHYFRAKLNGSNNQPDDSQNQPRRSKRKTKPVDRLKY
ncbi:unnamed protein product [Brachionus calyciflorus]|uniref:Integrase p58-like C-terminal domain-containing protein n=1 Tax=Brachionus calyciflorus TaxID=104777 RepID=A0A814LKI8_9BILA|nr:unnamed protein product [Brachionus calyciflorus]